MMLIIFVASLGSGKYEMESIPACVSTGGDPSQHLERKLGHRRDQT
jgi:hypothetical protein